ncbi:hypothetical protein AWC14_08790 [Mycobacterium kyorinense]|uniref:Uncharacterized protein n=1 Tax=Mycobacterium kyorinense TaxID=487514 RepID=A0A1X1XQT3_9MYCO|nr:hypothetical protein [Mycobacterium kyorinense]ORW01205.1 hypothetical protein AWC14_08790 [Mycobacterium kyorinense]
MHLHLHPALLLKNDEGFPDRHPARSELFSDVFLGKALAWAQLAGNDLAAKVIGDELTTAAT